MTNNTPNEIILARSYNDSIGEIKEVFDRALIMDKVEFIGWFMDNSYNLFPYPILAEYSIEEISEITEVSKEFIINFIDLSGIPKDFLTRRLTSKFCKNAPILQLSKITSIDRKKIEKLQDLRTRHPHCADEMLSLYFEIKDIIKKERLEEFIRIKRGKKKREENLSADEIKRIKDRETIKNKLASFLKNKKGWAFDEIENILDIKHERLKNIVSAHFSEKCLKSPDCPYQKYLEI